MKNMMMGLFLMLVSIWSYIFGVVDKVTLFLFIGVFGTIPAVIFFLVGYFEKSKKD